MKRIWPTSIIVFAFIDCAGGLSEEVIVVGKAAARSEYAKNSSQASLVLRERQNVLANKVAELMMNVVKKALNTACSDHIGHMVSISHVCDFAITRSAYMKGTNPSTDLTMHKQGAHVRGLGLVGSPTDECLRIGIQQIKASVGHGMEGIPDLSDQHAVYSRIFDLVEESNGLLVFYRQSMSDLRLQATMLSNELDGILKQEAE